MRVNVQCLQHKTCFFPLQQAGSLPPVQKRASLWKNDKNEATDQKCPTEAANKSTKTKTTLDAQHMCYEHTDDPKVFLFSVTPGKAPAHLQASTPHHRS
eukprot:m.1248754 g.1248754  ORF g.1248754 m.1248754 type:complete len:99 (-) comp24699_c0_seq1:107-403(-)